MATDPGRIQIYLKPYHKKIVEMIAEDMDTTVNLAARDLVISAISDIIKDEIKEKRHEMLEDFFTDELGQDRVRE